MISGSRVMQLCSADGHFSTTPKSPMYSPWSEKNTVTVRSAAPARRTPSSRRPTWESSRDTMPW
jgi:hypothetical protein